MTGNYAKEFAARLQARMDALGMNQSDLARKAKMPPVQAHKYVTGKTEPGLGAIIRLADAVDCEPWELLKSDETIAKPSLVPLLRDVFERLSTLNEAEMGLVLRGFGAVLKAPGLDSGEKLHSNSNKLKGKA
jgi:transcriptional regulator with XRE-family HTH domain